MAELNISMADFMTDYVLPLMGLSPDTDDYEEIYLSAGNVILQECFDINNRIRKRQDLEPIEDFVPLEQDDLIYFDRELMLNCCIFGWGAELVIDDTDDEMNKYSILWDRYQRGLQKYSAYDFCKVVTKYNF